VTAPSDRAAAASCIVIALSNRCDRIVQPAREKVNTTSEVPTDRVFRVGF